MSTYKIEVYWSYTVTAPSVTYYVDRLDVAQIIWTIMKTYGPDVDLNIQEIDTDD